MRRRSSFGTGAVVFTELANPVRDAQSTNTASSFAAAISHSNSRKSVHGGLRAGPSSLK